MRAPVRARRSGTLAIALTCAPLHKPGVHDTSHGDFAQRGGGVTRERQLRIRGARVDRDRVARGEERDGGGCEGLTLKRVGFARRLLPVRRPEA